MNKRLITERQEQIFRCCHHDFAGLTHEEAAKKLGISRQAIERALARVEEVAPDFFPILTQQEARCYHHLTVDGWTPDTIADRMDLSVNAIYKTLYRCKRKGLPFLEPHGRVLIYSESMDDKVVTKF